MPSPSPEPTDTLRLCDGCGHAIAFYDDAGTPVLASHVQMHKHHEGKPYMGCFLCRDEFVSRASLAAVLNDPQTLGAIRDALGSGLRRFVLIRRGDERVGRYERVRSDELARASLVALHAVLSRAGLTPHEEETPT